MSPSRGRPKRGTHGVPAAASRIGVSQTTPPPCPVSPQPGATRERSQPALILPRCLGRVGGTANGLSLYRSTLPFVSHVASAYSVHASAMSGEAQETERGWNNSCRTDPLSIPPRCIVQHPPSQAGLARNSGPLSHHLTTRSMRGELTPQLTPHHAVIRELFAIAARRIDPGTPRHSHPDGLNHRSGII